MVGDYCYACFFEQEPYISYKNISYACIMFLQIAFRKIFYKRILFAKYTRFSKYTTK